MLPHFYLTFLSEYKLLWGRPRDRPETTTAVSFNLYSREPPSTQELTRFVHLGEGLSTAWPHGMQDAIFLPYTHVPDALHGLWMGTDADLVGPSSSLLGAL